MQVLVKIILEPFKTQHNKVEDNIPISVLHK